MSAALAKCRLFEVCAQDRWDCQGTMLRVTFPDGWGWVPYGVVVNQLGRLTRYWNKTMPGHMYYRIDRNAAPNHWNQ